MDVTEQKRNGPEPKGRGYSANGCQVKVALDCGLVARYSVFSLRPTGSKLVGGWKLGQDNCQTNKNILPSVCYYAVPNISHNDSWSFGTIHAYTIYGHALQLCV